MNRYSKKSAYNPLKTIIHEDACPETLPMTWKCPAPENLEVQCGETPVFYTFNYNPGYQPAILGGKMHLSAISDFFKRVQETINKCHNIMVDMFPEVSPGGRIHFHGVCRFKTKENIIPFYVRDLKILNANSQGEIDTIKEREVRHGYCVKQRALMEAWCEKHMVSYLMQNYCSDSEKMNFEGLKE